MRKVGPLVGRAFITMGQGWVQRTTNCIGREMILIYVEGRQKRFQFWRVNRFCCQSISRHSLLCSKGILFLSSI